MTDYVVPVPFYPTEQTWKLVNFGALFETPFGGSPSTNSRGQRWQCTMRWEKLRGTDKARMTALLASMRGVYNRLWVKNYTVELQGSFACPELITNGWAYVNGAPSSTGWTASSGDITVAADNALGLRIQRVNVNVGETARHGSISTVANAYYAFRQFIYSAKGALIDGVLVGTTAGAADVLLGTNRTTSGRYIESFTTANTTLHPSLADNAAGKFSGDFHFVTGVSIARCGRVNGSVSAQATLLTLKNLPTSTAALLRAGDWIEVNGELKVCLHDVSSDSSGNAQVNVEPAFRAALTDGMPVIARDPMGKFVMAESGEWPTEIKDQSDFTMRLIEA
jgi:hypothetical protein